LHAGYILRNKTARRGASAEIVEKRVAGNVGKNTWGLSILLSFFRLSACLVECVVGH